ncbi:MAG: FkbM family methyltransferase [Chitinophagaceae bacterium]|nr:FkbM family methyltransferase [Chitinophagaceae bacterium]
MTQSIKAFFYRNVSLENYLRILQRSYFFLYRTGYLKKNPIYKYHYFVKNLIQPGDTIIDIGANLGYYSILFSKWTGPEGSVHAVEPVSTYNKIFNELARKRKNITLYPYAMGSANKKITIVDPVADLEKNRYLSTGLMHVYDKEKDGELAEHKYSFEAEMRKPSELFGGLEKINYIKCDVEGFEVTVLTEMEELIKNHRPTVQVEVAPENRAAILALFGRLNYSVHGLIDGQLTPLSESLPKTESEFIFKPEL